MSAEQKDSTPTQKNLKSVTYIGPTFCGGLLFRETASISTADGPNEQTGNPSDATSGISTKGE